MSKDDRFLRSAVALAQIWSKDPSTKVGAVAVGDQPNKVVWGFNGIPPGIADTDERLNDRDVKLSLTLHAEVNALANAPFDVCTLYVTHHPCAACALHILAARTVKRVVYRIDRAFQERWSDSIGAARKLFLEAGVTIEGVEL